MAAIRGRVALVTGASSGIGEAAALALEQSGFLTIATARDESVLRPLRERGCETLQLDVTDEASLEQAVRTAENRFGPIYVLVNNNTASNAEQFTVKLRRLKNVKVFGETTMGKITYGINIDQEKLFPSAKFKIVLTDMPDDGNFLPYEEKGIDPDVFLDNNGDWMGQVKKIVMRDK